MSTYLTYSEWCLGFYSCADPPGMRLGKQLVFLVVQGAVVVRTVVHSRRVYQQAPVAPSLVQLFEIGKMYIIK